MSRIAEHHQAFYKNTKTKEDGAFPNQYTPTNLDMIQLIIQQYDDIFKRFRQPRHQA